MKTLHNNYCNSKQGYLPLFLSDCLDLLDPVLTFDRLMGGIDLNKYLTDIPEYTTGRLRYNPVNMLKTVLFGFMTSGYCSLRELEDNCKVNIRFMYLMDHQTPSYRTFGYFINEILQDKIESIFNDINHAIFNEEHVDLQHLYIDGSKFEANANKYTWVWKKATEKFRYKLYEKITAEIEEINAEIAWSGVQITTNKNPDVNFEVHDGITYTLYDYLQEGIIDISVVRTPLRLDEVESVILHEEPMIAVSNPAMSENETDSLALTDLVHKPLILYRRYEKLIMDAFHAQNLVPEVFCLCDDARGATLWVKEGLATAIFPQSMQPLCEGLTCQVLDEVDLMTKILLIWKKERKPSALVQEFMKVCLK